MARFIIRFTRTPRTGALAGMDLPSSFRTTADAVELSVRGLRANPEISDVRVEAL